MPTQETTFPLTVATTSLCGGWLLFHDVAMVIPLGDRDIEKEADTFITPLPGTTSVLLPMSNSQHEPTVGNARKPTRGMP